jgi:large subunit ribosomal protein L29
MTPEEIRALGPEELGDRILEMEDELFRLRIQNEMGQLDNPILVRDMKRNLARCKTIRREYELKGER